MQTYRFTSPRVKFCPRSIFWIVMVLSMYALLPFAQVYAANTPPLRVVYGFDRDFPPFSYEEAGGVAVGFEIDLVDAIFNAPNIVLQKRPLKWEEVQLELSAGTITVTSGIVRTEQRAKMFLFSDKPSFPLQIRLFTKVYNRFASAFMLKGQKVSVMKGSFAHRLLDNFGGTNIITFDSVPAALRALYTDDVAAYCAPVQTTYYYINKLNYGAITTVGTPLGITEMRFAVNRGRGDLLRIINTRLEELMQSGEYDRIYRKWFVRELVAQEQLSLIQAAKTAAIPAYVPYHAPAQGAAVLTTTGRIYSACTVENADETLTISATRNAVAKAIADGEFEIRAVVLTDQKGSLTMPDSRDLQTLYEFGQGILVITAEKNGQYETSMVSELLQTPITQQSGTIDVE